MLEKALRILQAFRPEDDHLRLASLVERTGMPKSTVHRLVTELLDHGLLEHDDRRGYRPGIVLFELSSLVPLSRHLREEALPFLQDLFLATHQTVHLAVREGTDSVYVEKIHGHSDLGLPSRVGGRLPLVCTGVGRALLAFSDPEIQRQALSRPTRRLLDRAVLDPGRLALDLAEVRCTGLSYERGEIAAGHGCIASPVLVDGVPVAAISLSVPIHHYNLPALAGSVRKAATALAGRLAQTPATVLGRAG
jgi:DNA-binding IclR family transcriptional regulator